MKIGVLRKRAEEMNDLKRIDVIAKAICRSGKFECGEGACSFICLDQLGSARCDCSHATDVHNVLAVAIEKAISRNDDA